MEKETFHKNVIPGIPEKKMFKPGNYLCQMLKSKMSQRIEYWLLQGVIGSRTTATAKAETTLALLQVGKQSM